MSPYLRQDALALTLGPELGATLAAAGSELGLGLEAAADGGADLHIVINSLSRHA